LGRDEAFARRLRTILQRLEGKVAAGRLRWPVALVPLKHAARGALVEAGGHAGKALCMLEELLVPDVNPLL
jgi:hypothetical protein